MCNALVPSLKFSRQTAHALLDAVSLQSHSFTMFETLSVVLASECSMLDASAQLGDSLQISQEQSPNKGQNVVTMMIVEL